MSPTVAIQAATPQVPVVTVIPDRDIGCIRSDDAAPASSSTPGATAHRPHAPLERRHRHLYPGKVGGLGTSTPVDLGWGTGQA